MFENVFEAEAQRMLDEYFALRDKPLEFLQPYQVVPLGFVPPVEEVRVLEARTLAELGWSVEQRLERQQFAGDEYVRVEQRNKAEMEWSTSIMKNVIGEFR